MAENSSPMLIRDCHMGKPCGNLICHSSVQLVQKYMFVRTWFLTQAEDGDISPKPELRWAVASLRSKDISIVQKDLGNGW